MYYNDKVKTLRDVFGTKDVSLEQGSLSVAGKRYPIIDDVIILSEPAQYTEFVKSRLKGKNAEGPLGPGGPLGPEGPEPEGFAGDIQYTFGEEWKKFGKILPEHEKEFSQYFDIVDLDSLKNSRICDLGCGSGRWSYFLKGRCREIVLVDFSDAIFVARKNLSGANNCLFFMGDLKRLPFREGFADFLFCLGVLHHLPTPCLDEVRNLKRFAPLLLIYLYYNLDNRPFHFRLGLKTVTFLRMQTSRIRGRAFRKMFSKAGTFLVYIPFVSLGRLLGPLGLGRHVPLYEGYRGKSAKRIEQDVYDRFFTRIEQRVSRKDVLGLKDTFSDVKISPNLPYYHFLCKR